MGRNTKYRPENVMPNMILKKNLPAEPVEFSWFANGFMWRFFLNISKRDAIFYTTQTWNTISTFCSKFHRQLQSAMPNLSNGISYTKTSQFNNLLLSAKILLLPHFLLCPVPTAFLPLSLCIILTNIGSKHQINQFANLGKNTELMFCQVSALDGSQ